MPRGTLAEFKQARGTTGESALRDDVRAVVADLLELVGDCSAAVMQNTEMNSNGHNYMVTSSARHLGSFAPDTSPQ